MYRRVRRRAFQVPDTDPIQREVNSDAKYNPMRTVGTRRPPSLKDLYKLCFNAN